MNAALLTLGTRGDVQPYLALALGLRDAGHRVKLATSVDFQEWVSSLGLAFAPLRISIRGLLSDPEVGAVFESKRAALRAYRKTAPLMPGLLEDAFEAAQGADLILFHPKILNALDIAERLGIPAMAAFYLPALALTADFPAPFIAGRPTYGRAGNRLTHLLFLRLLTAPYLRLVNRWRTRSAGLKALPLRMLMANRFDHRVPKIYGYSAHLVPTPRDWDSSNHVTGQWFLPQPADFEPPADLVRFLSAGEPPVAVGFGSISGRTPERTTQAVMQALVIAGCRAVIVGGWGGLAAVHNSERVHYVRSVPYHWLLPRVAAVVHHGGAGSTGETLRAGKPAVVCPFFGDQTFWGRRVAAVGAGPEPIPQRQLTPESLAGALRVVLVDPGMRRRAEELGARVRAEEGVKAAVSVIQREWGARQAATR